MNDILNKIKLFYSQNKTLSYILIAVLAVFFLPVHKLFKKKRRYKRRSTRTRTTRRRRTSPARRSTSRASSGGRRAGYTMGVNGTWLRIPAGKKPWQVKGSLAARRRMAKIRKMR